MSAGEGSAERCAGEEPAREGELIGGLPGVRPGRPMPIEDRDSRMRMRRDHQVSVRLTGWQFGLLSSAGDLYGLSPTEMARLFINRGARAVLNERKREPGP